MQSTWWRVPWMLLYSIHRMDAVLYMNGSSCTKWTLNIKSVEWLLEEHLSHNEYFTNSETLWCKWHKQINYYNKATHKLHLYFMGKKKSHLQIACDQKITLCFISYVAIQPCLSNCIIYDLNNLLNMIYRWFPVHITIPHLFQIIIIITFCFNTGILAIGKLQIQLYNKACE